MKINKSTSTHKINRRQLKEIIKKEINEINKPIRIKNKSGDVSVRFETPSGTIWSFDDYLKKLLKNQHFPDWVGKSDELERWVKKRIKDAIDNLDFYLVWNKK